ncbi:MAG TPA: hypothetical protein PLD27_01885 [bacterium]|nr:hypothetical protein [bacterium]HOL46706.1 hypothetical protein [bacterium]HPQ18394.1 hypothetical protein [bacterium]
MINLPYYIKQLISNKDFISTIKIIIFILIIAAIIYIVSKYIELPRLF